MGRQVEYDERLTVPWWWWPFGAGVAAVLAVEVHLAAPWLPLVLVVLAAAALPFGLLFGVGRARVTVREGRIEAGGARLPLHAVAEVAPLDRVGKRALLGPRGDPAGYVVQRAWAPGAVYLRLTDDLAEVPGAAPYWLVSTRRPAELAAALEQARARL